MKEHRTERAGHHFFQERLAGFAISRVM